jgi:hypothetical protein
MRIRDLLTSGVSIAVVAIHFAVQWYGWKLHVGEAADPTMLPPGDLMWQVCSFPLFTLVPRRLHYLYFLEMLVANSAIWGLVAAWSAHRLFRRVRIGGRVHRQSTLRGGMATTPTAALPTRTDRLVELKRMRDQGLVTKEEYVRQREGIINEIASPPPRDSIAVASGAQRMPRRS